MTAKGVIRMTRASFDGLPAPADAMIGDELYVESDANKPGFRAVARKDDAGVNEWYVEADTFQVGITNALTINDVPAAATAQGSPVPVDIRDWSEIRFSLYVKTAGNTSEARLHYYTDLDAGGQGTTLTTNTIDLSTTGAKETDYEPIPAGARTQPINVILATLNGDAAEDPRVYAVVAHFRR